MSPNRKKSRSRSRRTSRGLPVLLALVALAVVGGCALLRPGSTTRSNHRVAAPVAGTSAAPDRPASSAPATAPTGASAAPVTIASAIPTPVAAASGARVALIVDDCGQWLQTERAFIALPIPVTLSVLPDVRYTAAIAREAHDAGKGVMLHLPMETLSGTDPGRGKVTTSMSDAQITAQVDDDLSQVPLAQGVNNHEGSKGSADRRVMDDVVRAIAARGDLFFIDSRTSAATVGETAARAAGLASASRAVFLDDVDDEAAIETQLRAAADIAVTRGSAIAIGHPRAATLAAVQALYPELQRRGITFVLASSLTSR